MAGLRMKTVSKWRIEMRKAFSTGSKLLIKQQLDVTWLCDILQFLYHFHIYVQETRETLNFFVREESSLELTQFIFPSFFQLQNSH